MARYGEGQHGGGARRPASRHSRRAGVYVHILQTQSGFCGNLPVSTGGANRVPDMKKATGECFSFNSCRQQALLFGTAGPPYLQNKPVKDSLKLSQRGIKI